MNPSTPPGKSWRISRRGFLIGLGSASLAVGVGVVAGLPALRLFIADTLDAGGGPPGAASQDPLAWFEITPDNRVRLFISKVEMGQGIHTALAQIGAEELEVAWEQIEVVQGTTHVGRTDTGVTSASNSVSTTYTRLRQAAATLREMLRLEAARRLQVAPAALLAQAGTFAVRDDPDRRILYGELVGLDVVWQEPEAEPTLKAPQDFRLIGQPLARLDLPAKIIGQAVYGYDVRLPDMLYGAVAHPPTLTARLRSAGAGDAAGRPGVAHIMLTPDVAGVAAHTRAQARGALAALDLTWEEGHPWQQAELDALVQVGERGGVTIQHEGNAADLLAHSATHRATYRTPLAAHAQLEPQAALADVQADRTRIWVSTQGQESVRRAVAQALKLDDAAVEVIPTYLGGGFGRKIGTEAAVEAALLSQAAGRPVHVGWDRREEMHHGYLRPPTQHQLAARLQEGRIVALEHQQASGDVAFDFLPDVAAAVLGADFGAWRGARLFYTNILHRSTEVWRIALPVRTGWWRGLGLLANTFAVESFMDEMAHLAGADPLAFRLAHLGNDAISTRLKGVLNLAAEKAGWGRAPAEGHALGLACCVDVGTVVAQVAEISLERATGQVRVHRVTAAVDPGLVINPDGAAAQTQGAIIMGLSSTLKEEVTIQDGQIRVNNFDAYPLLTIQEAPAIQVEMVSSGNQPFGMGEPPIGPIAAAVGNAFFRLTGVRLRQLPFQPERVLAALA